MAAYSAAVSLKNTIRRNLQSSRISLVPPSLQILQPVFDAMVRLQKVLLKLDETSCSKIRTKVNDLDERIKVVVWEFEDLLESHFTDQILPLLESSSERDHLPFSVDLQSLRQSAVCFVERVAVMEEKYNIERLNMPEEEGQPLSSRIDCGGINSKLVGLSYEFYEILDDCFDGGNWVLIAGMAGVGKTALAKKVFEDPSIQRHFKFRAWVKVGRKCEFNEVLRCILAQVDPNIHDRMLTQGADDENDERLVGLLKERLKNKECLVVLDDVWDSRVMEHLPRKLVQILFTSRLGMIKSLGQRLGLLNFEESMQLLGDKVFGEEGFPPHLKKLGEKIAEKCEGLPLMIVTVAELLSKEEKTPQFWTEVAERQHHSIFMDAYDQISEVLFPSYEYLPQHLKMLFLYMGAFPPYSGIELKHLLLRLRAEGFLESIRKQALEDFMDEEKTWEDTAINCLLKLVFGYHVVLEEPKQEFFLSNGQFRVHTCWQHLCRNEASKIKFLHVLQKCDDVMKDQRRLCAHWNTLFSIKDVYESIKSGCASRVRSLLCFGPYHQYPVPIHAMDLKLLGVLDAQRVRFYHIPPEIFKLICLKYLALTCNQELPVSISNLFHLQFLTINTHMCIQKRGVRSVMPVEIWNMQELQHIEVSETELPTPNSDASLNKLSYLHGVSEKSCTRDILKRVSNLETLGIQVELKPYSDDRNLLDGLEYISDELQNLISLHYLIMNPDMKYEFMVPLSMFPSNLTSLFLRGIGCPWKHMNDIGSLLPNLSSLCLDSYAFRGPDWDIESGCFLKLKELIITDSDLVRWRPQPGSFPRLDLLSIWHCYKLQQLEWTIDFLNDMSLFTMRTVRLVDCNPLAVVSAKQMKPKYLFNIIEYSSF